MRITIKHLRPLVDRLNRVAGTPSEPWTRGEDGKLRANIGNFHLSAAYGGYCLHQMANERGGVNDVFGVGHVPARHMYDQIHAFLRGIEYGKEKTVGRMESNGDWMGTHWAVPAQVWRSIKGVE